MSRTRMRPAPKVSIQHRFLGYERCVICGEGIEVWRDRWGEKDLVFAFHNGAAYIQRNKLVSECIVKQKKEAKMREAYRSLKRKRLA